MALLLAGLPDTIPGITVNRLCASGLNAVGAAAQAIRAGEIDFAIAGGVELMTRAPLRHGQGAGGVPAQRRDPRHHHRLALHQSADEAAIRRRPDAGDRRERRRGIPGGAQGPGRLRLALAAARRQGGGGGLLRRRDRAGRGAGRQGRTRRGGQGRASAARHDARRPRQAQAVRAQSRHDHGRQRVRRQRRRRRRDHRVGAGRQGARAHALCPRPRHGVRRRAAAHHGHRPGAVDPQADGAARPQDRRFRLDRAQRGLRLAGARLPAPARACRTMPSTSTRTAARSRSAIRSACRGRGSRSRSRTSSKRRRAGAASPPCAWVGGSPRSSGQVSISRSSGHRRRPERWRTETPPWR